VNAKNFDRWVLCIAILGFAAIAVYGMRIGNAAITSFGKDNFALFSGGLLILLNRELIGASNGNGNGNGSGTANPPQAH
jgi:hypothetical protein